MEWCKAFEEGVRVVLGSALLAACLEFSRSRWNCALVDLV